MDVTALKELPETLEELYAEVQDSDELNEDLRAEMLEALETAEEQIRWILSAVKEI